MSINEIRENFDMPGCSTICDQIQNAVQANIDQIKQSVPGDTKQVIETNISDSIKGQTFQIPASQLVGDDTDTINMLKCLIPLKEN